MRHRTRAQTERIFGKLDAHSAVLRTILEDLSQPCPEAPISFKSIVLLQKAVECLDDAAKSLYEQTVEVVS